MKTSRRPGLRAATTPSLDCPLPAQARTTVAIHVFSVKVAPCRLRLRHRALRALPCVPGAGPWPVAAGLGAVLPPGVAFAGDTQRGATREAAPHPRTQRRARRRSPRAPPAPDTRRTQAAPP